MATTDVPVVDLAGVVQTPRKHQRVLSRAMEDCDFVDPIMPATTDAVPNESEPVMIPIMTMPGSSTPGGGRSRSGSATSSEIRLGLNDDRVVVTRRIDDVTSRHRRVLSDRPHLWHLVESATEQKKFVDLEADYSNVHLEESLIKQLVSSANVVEEDGFGPGAAEVVNAVASAVQHNKKKRFIACIPSVDAASFKAPRIIEERQLWNLLLLDDPLTNIMFLTSTPIPTHVISYYLTMCKAGEDPAKMGSKDLILFEKYNRMQRLHLLSVHDTHTDKSLSEKILSRPNLIARMREVCNSVYAGDTAAESIAALPSMTLPALGISNASYDIPHAAGVTMFCGTPETEKISEMLGLRMLEAGTEALHWGTKQGCRELFHSCGIPMAAGTPDASTGDYIDLLEFGGNTLEGAVDSDDENKWAENIRYIRKPRNLAIGIARQIISKNIRPNMWMVKLNVSSGGRGNAHLNLRKLKPDFSKVQFDYEDPNKSPMSAIVEVMADEVEKWFPKMRFEAEDMTWDAFKLRMTQVGAIGEAYLEGSIITSPSCQAVVEPRGGTDGDTPRVTVISTHEQILHGQVYYGCKNPAFHSYRGQLVEYGRRLGYELAKHGFVGHFAADFLAAGDSTLDSSLYAIEINLRQSGTTHSYKLASILTRGHMDNDGMLRTYDGQARSYVATDKFQHDNLIGVKSEELLKSVQNPNDPEAVEVNWNPLTMTGTVFHVFYRLENKGAVGYTSIGRTDEEAQEIYDKTGEFLAKLKSKLGH